MNIAWSKVALILGVLIILSALLVVLGIRGVIPSDVLSHAVTTIVGMVAGWLSGVFTDPVTAFGKPPSE